jgi:hypothetical protein
LMVENEGIFEFGMNGGYFVVISVDWLALKSWRLSLIWKITYFLGILIHLSLSDGNVSIELFDSAFIVFGVICFKWRHIVRVIVLGFSCFRCVGSWTRVRSLDQ